MPNEQQADRMTSGKGFVAALDQSGGSTPKALRLYGIEDDAYSSEEEMFDLIHQMRSRIITSPAFTGDRVLAAILFEQTMDRDIEGRPSTTYLWETKGVVPILKIDKGLAEASDDVQLMKPMPGLDGLLERAVGKGVFGTKERSVIGGANAEGIAAVVAQQFEVARQVLSHGLVPIIEPEVTISISDKAQAEEMLRDEITKHLETVPDGQRVMLKLTLPTEANHYRAAGGPPEGDAGARALRRLFPRRGQRAAGQEHRGDRQLQPRADRGTVGRPVRRAVQRHPGQGDPVDLRRLGRRLSPAGATRQ